MPSLKSNPKPGILEALRNLPDIQLAILFKKAVGFRNIAVHNYAAVDWTIVHSIARNHLDDFSNFARRVSSRLGES